MPTRNVPYWLAISPYWSARFFWVVRFKPKKPKYDTIRMTAAAMLPI